MHINKTCLIFKHEFLHTVKRTGFIIMTLIVPVLALLGIGLGQLVSNISKSEVKEIKRIGYVDEVGQFYNTGNEGGIALVRFHTQEDAIQALINNNVSEYFLIEEDYLLTGIIHRYTLDKEVTTPPATRTIIKDFLTSNLLAGKVGPETITLIKSPLNLKVTRLTQTGTVAPEQSGLGNIIIPGAFAMLLAFSLMFCSNCLVQGLAEEKESRLIEVLLSSVSIRQLLIGKVSGLGAAGLAQVLVWLISAPLLLNLATSSFSGFISSIHMPAHFIILGIVYFILGYLLFAVFSIGVGAISSNVREGEQLALIYTLFGSFTPIWFVSLLFIFPKSPIWIYIKNVLSVKGSS